MASPAKFHHVILSPIIISSVVSGKMTFAINFVMRYLHGLENLSGELIRA